MSNIEIRKYIDDACSQLKQCYSETGKAVIPRITRKNVSFRVEDEHHNWEYTPLNVGAIFYVDEYVNEDDYGIVLSTDFSYSSHYEDARIRLKTQKRDRIYVTAGVDRGFASVSKFPEQVILLENNDNLDADFARVLQETKKFFMEQVDIIVHELNNNYPIPKKLE